MRGVRIEVEVASKHAEALQAAAYALGVQGLEILDADVGLPRGRAGVRLYVPEGAEADAACEALRRVPGARVRSEAYARVATPSRGVRLGSRFVVSPEPPVRAGSRTWLPLDGSAAFGDGLHPTTRLVVDALERVVSPRRHRRALDVGTGTGVLALVALALGVSEVVATDVDPLARRAAKDAAKALGQAARLRVRATMPRETFPLVTANLYRDLLLTLAPRLAARVAPSGLLVLSGFGPASRREVQRAFEAEGFVLEQARTRASWCVAVLRKNRSRPGRVRGRIAP